MFAITQVSHLLVDHLTWEGAAQSALVLLVVWWGWNYTAWFTNEVDLDSLLIRGVLIALMLASLVLAVAIPQAFGAHGLLFAAAYVTIQVGRQAFLTFVAAPHGSLERERSLRILDWFVVAGAFCSPAAWRRTVPAGRSGWSRSRSTTRRRSSRTRCHSGRGSPTAWQVETSHFAERFQLFVIIALGESIVVTGATTTEVA